MPSAPPTPAQVPVAQDQLPPYSWRTLTPSAQLIYLQTVADANNAISLLNTAVVGFDLEWKPVWHRDQPQNPVALVQLSNGDTILLIQISRMQGFPTKLRELLENPDILKAGVGIQKDATKLFNDTRVAMRGCVDLALLARTVDNAQWKGRYTDPIGLARLVKAYESLAMDKGRVQRSNWERRLTPAQQDYAANDAHAGFMIYNRLEELLNKMTTTPKAEYYIFDCIGGALRLPSGAYWSPSNPDYDPGPPPPPKIQKDKKQNLPNAAVIPVDPNMQPDNIGSPVPAGKEGDGEPSESKAAAAGPTAQQNNVIPKELPVPEKEKAKKRSEDDRPRYVDKPPSLSSIPPIPIGSTTNANQKQINRSRPLRGAPGEHSTAQGSHQGEPSDLHGSNTPHQQYRRRRRRRAKRGQGIDTQQV